MTLDEINAGIYVVDIGCGIFTFTTDLYSFKKKTRMGNETVYNETKSKGE